MPSSLNVIALISGGKDSLFSMLHCLANGHSVVALANLHPPASTTSDDDDLNSYMYQTVGHAIIPLYQEALGIPLYRQEIRGSAVNSARDYSVQEDDETEDLLALLKKVKEAHPEVNAVSTGAIFSTYQRTRVESVAVRLGLTPLSFLWQYPLLPPYLQSSLLNDMLAVGQDARIIKVASGGLDESFLWQNVADNKTVARMKKAIGRFSEVGDGALLGEGGEFETLAVDGPAVLWKKRIEVEDDGAVLQSGGTAIWKGKNARVVEKSGDATEGLVRLRIPPLFDDQFARLLGLSLDMGRLTPSVQHPQRRFSELGVRHSPPSDTPTAQLDAEQPADLDPQIASLSESTKKKILNEHSSVSTSLTKLVQASPWLRGQTQPTVEESRMRISHGISNTLQARVLTYNNLAAGRTSKDIKAELRDILHFIEEALEGGPYFESSMSKKDITHVTLLLRDMADFAELNAVYAEYFDYTNPPARVTVAVGDFLPETVNVMLSIVAHKDVERNGLHVQSQSYWAPANIGPYSQAITVPVQQLHDLKVDPTASREVHIAGQIPLRSSSMELYTDEGFKGQALLSLQHLWRIGRATGVRWWPAGVAYLPYSDDRKEQESRILYVQAMWKAVHALDDASNETDDEADEVDAWDRKNLHAAFDDRNPPPRLVRPAGTSSGGFPPCYVVEVDALPRNAAIEWSCTGLTGGNQPGAYHSMSSAELQMGGLGFQTIQRWVHGTAYVADTECVKLPSSNWAFWGVQWVPCKHVWGWKGDEVGAVIVGRPVC